MLYSHFLILPRICWHSHGCLSLYNPHGHRPMWPVSRQSWHLARSIFRTAASCNLDGKVGRANRGVHHQERLKDGIIYIIWIMWLSNVKYGYIQMGSFVDIYIYINRYDLFILVAKYMVHWTGSASPGPMSGPTIHGLWQFSYWMAHIFKIGTPPEREKSTSRIWKRWCVPTCLSFWGVLYRFNNSIFHSEMRSCQRDPKGSFRFSRHDFSANDESVVWLGLESHAVPGVSWGSFRPIQQSKAPNSPQLVGFWVP